ncbi:unnamed protein product [Clonostachys rosea f. rosea IK726]|jgi:homocysteine S-methyltransferase|uniref:Uncharacterized protein n=1 Tax=Clonostachys rosea f. rosea IK726 TaxID=1349383 RepID=A0ACA9THZ8_BIOOC|nr:unnamed protein product [Clonostachys rosea f. rosea IK726]
MTQIKILDGGLGTSLETDFTVKFSSHSTPLWSSHLLVSDNETLLRCQSNFGRVPVDVLLTATYQVSVQGFADTRTSQNPGGIPPAAIPGYIETAISIAERAKASHAQVALSVGPYGACMIPSQEYSGRYDAAHDSGEALEAWHRERLSLFGEAVRGGASSSSRIGFVALETLPRVDEIAAVRRAIASVEELNSVPYWVSALFPGEAETLPDGSSVEATVRAMLDPGVGPVRPWGVGINCTKTWKLDSLLRKYEGTIAKMVEEGVIDEWPALVLYPDGTNGEVYNTETQKWEVPVDGLGENQVPWETQLADVVRQTQSRGSWPEILVGGCCMASYKSIASLRATLLPESSS